MPADALDPSDAPPPVVAALPTEKQRAVRAMMLGAALGAILAVLGRRRGAGASRYSR
jgi:hypothetical protein